MNNAQKVQRPLLNFNASNDKAKEDKAKDQNQEDIYHGNDAGDNDVMKFKLVDFDIHDEMKDKFFTFTDSYDAWMNRHEYEDQKLIPCCW